MKSVSDYVKNKIVQDVIHSQELVVVVVFFLNNHIGTLRSASHYVHCLKIQLLYIVIFEYQSEQQRIRYSRSSDGWPRSLRISVR